MTTTKQVHDLLVLGRKINSEKYAARCQVHHAKTFYYLCERLCEEAEGKLLPSSALRVHIHAQLKLRQVVVDDAFNPEGWFGKAWTEWLDPEKNEKHFKPEYLAVLGRTGAEPYFYHLQPAWDAFVRNTFKAFQDASSLVTATKGQTVEAK